MSALARFDQKAKDDTVDEGVSEARSMLGDLGKALTRAAQQIGEADGVPQSTN
ncbi:hypothetical protein ACWCXS_32165 [Streptomyces sp. NPDC001685]